jgi:DNA-binding transcriptional regulator YhcF (GntR family)
MNAHVPTESYLRACALLDRITRQTTASEHGRLPTIAALAKMASVRSATMCQALAELKSRGIVQTRQRAGTVVNKAGDARPASVEREPINTPRGLKWQQVHDRLKSDIITGQYRVSSILPPPKELCERYGVAYPTLRKALGQLLSERMITPYRRTYRLAAATLTATRRTIVLIARGDGDRHISLDWELQAERYRLLETECARAGIRLVTATGYYVDDRLCGLDEIEQVMNDPLLRPSILGYFVWSNALPDNFLEKVLSLASDTRMPVSILDDRARPESREMAGRNPRARLFENGSDTDPGRQLARHLLALGHRRIAYIYPQPAGAWAHNRLKGVQEEFALLGGEITSLPVRDLSSYEQAFTHPLDAVGVLKSLTRHHLPQYRGTHSLPKRIQDVFSSQVDQSVQHQLYYDAMHPLLESVIARDDITAVVGASDAIAAICMDFLHLKGVPVSQRMSVAGFGDCSEATRLHLTSFNFNTFACIQAMLNHTVHTPRHTRAKAANRNKVEISGFVTARDSTGKALTKGG